MLTVLARASLEGAVLAAAVWLLCRLLTRMPPRVRALLWWCVAAKFVVALAWPAPIAVPVLPAADTVTVTAAAPVSTAGAAAAAERPASPPVPAPGAPEIPWTALLVGVWALGLGVSLLRTLHSWHRTRAVVARSLPGGEGLHATVRELSDRLGLRRAADVRVSAEVESPLVIGVRRPVILVPAAGFALLSPDEQRMALCHELAQLKRGDVWLGCVPAAAERCFFFHPLARLAAREYAFWREGACDEAVLTTLGASPQSYGRMLLALGVSRRTATFSAAGAAWSFQNLKRRITMLDRTSPPSLRGRVLAAGVVALAIVSIAPLKAVARAAAPAEALHTLAPVAAAGRAPVTPAAARPADPAEAVPAVAETEDPRSQEELRFVLFRADGNTTMSGSTDDIERARRQRRGDEPLLWFRYEGRAYVIRAPAVLREVEALWEPMSEIGQEQSRIGAQQSAIGERQSAIGARQSEIGEEQGRIGERMGAIGARLSRLATREADASASERREIEQERRSLEAEMRRLQGEMGELSRRMQEASEPMSEHGEEMAELGEEMAVLGNRMREAAERANDRMVGLVRRAIDSGAAVAVD